MLRRLTAPRFTASFLAAMACFGLPMLSDRSPAIAEASPALSQLERQFQDPPPQFRPWVHWFWMDGNVTREGITADLEALQRVGLGGVVLMDITHDVPQGPVRFFSSEWRALFRHAIAEAERLGLQVSMNNGPGYTGSGGPWVTPELSMQKLVQSTLELTGPRKFSGLLPRLPTWNGISYHVATLAFPTPPGERQILPIGKSGMGPYTPPSGRPPASVPAINKNQVVHLDAKVNADGLLTWDVPPGKWTVLRLGCMPTGKMTPATRPEAAGLECDKLSKAAVAAHFSSFLEKLLEDSPGAGGKPFTFTHIDSWELGYQNWTPRFREEFLRLRGYDPLLYLPAFTGRIVESTEVTERFLWDVRRTIADLQAENYAGHLAELVNEQGLKLSAEAYGLGPFDDLLYASRVDVPMSEFWNESDDYAKFHTSKCMASVAHVYGKPVVAAEAFTAWPPNASWRNHPFTLKVLGDTAFCYGVNRLVFHRYAHQPWLNLKPGMTMGMWGVHYERTQTWWEHSKPWHEYLARCQLLLQQGRFCADVLYLTGEGAYARPPSVGELEPPPPPGYDYDLAPPEAVFTRLTVKSGQLHTPDGASYRVLVLPPADQMTPRLLNRVKELVQQGATVVGRPPVTSPSLEGYPASDRLVKELAADLWGKADGRRTTENRFGDGRVVWGKPLDRLLQEQRAPPDFTAGQVPGRPLRYIHRALDDGSDIYFVASPNSNSVIAECRFRVARGNPEMWDPVSGEIQRIPATRRDSSTTSVQVPFEPFGSRFIVFHSGESARETVSELTRDGRSDHSVALSYDDTGKLALWTSTPGIYRAKLSPGTAVAGRLAALPGPITVNGPWQLRFPPGWGAPAEVTLSRLVAWNQHPDSGVRFFSGRATYSTHFDLPAEYDAPDRRVLLDLGDVAVLCAIRLNGNSVATLWKPPFVADVTRFIKPGENHLEIDVVNLWPNRMIGDEHLPQDCLWSAPEPGATGNKLLAWPEWLLEDKPRTSGRFTFATRRFYSKHSPLLTSGLLGPVGVRCEKRVVLVEGGGFQEHGTESD